ncbi:hypothetical protein AKJ65_02440 [candidate division MSBL1 archaeon SCGC-AAA259E19]|uniref:SLC41A/MgtE integral membrane domain-containing protein n=1 Tax=candidate division MSBL1 archaeon SCGC-AAA259E19 TaxID=1698264 RepID=A0A133ULU9_9EURY|nr:hypothetical protein AKJ65_02440 [candidate division MSBL1 archaeon SCGC-AAA259E19]
MVKTEVSDIVKGALPVLLFCALFQVGAGSILGGMESEFRILPGLLVMVPPLLGLRGNISGALASRLGTGLHQGIIDPGSLWGPEVRTNVGASVFLTFMVSVVAGFLALAVTILTGNSFSFLLLSRLVLIAVLAGMLSSAGLISLTVMVALFSYRRGWDPDNVTSPLMASIGDLVTVLSIYGAFVLVKTMILVG